MDSGKVFPDLGKFLRGHPCFCILLSSVIPIPASFRLKSLLYRMFIYCSLLDTYIVMTAQHSFRDVT